VKGPRRSTSDAMMSRGRWSRGLLALDTRVRRAPAVSKAVHARRILRHRTNSTNAPTLRPRADTRASFDDCWRSRKVDGDSSHARVRFKTAVWEGCVAVGNMLKAISRVERGMVGQKIRGAEAAKDQEGECRVNFMHTKGRAAGSA